MSLDDDVRDELRQLDAAHRLRAPRIVDGMPGTRLLLDGLEVTSFASNDYLSLAGDPRLARAACAAAEESGTGVGSSRLIVGNHRRHVALEAALSDWFRSPGVRFFNSGFAANVGVLTTLLGPDDVVFSDELNHASIIDGCRLSRARIVVFPHLDVGALESEIATKVAGSARRRIIVSETLFSMDGDIADVAALSSLARAHDAALILDEAHAIGVYGPEGRGIAANAGVTPDVLVGTCGKSLGCFGAFAISSRLVADLLWNRARPLVFSTGLPPMIPAAVQAAVEIVRGTEGNDRRRALAARARELRTQIPELGGDVESPIAPLVVGEDRRALQLTQRLIEQNVFVQAIRPPTVPEGTSRLRISLASGHTTDEVSNLATLLDNAMRQFHVQRHG